MAGGSSSSLSRELLKRMREIRQKHRLDQVVLSACMGLPAQAIKHIESGRQRLPGIQGAAGPSLHEWFEDWFRCVEATASERREITDLLVLMIVGGEERDLRDKKG